MSEKLILTKEQEDKIIKLWNESEDKNLSIISLIKVAFPDIENPDSRTKEGILVRKFLVSQQITPPTSEYKKKGLLELTHEQKQYIENNCSNMNSLEMSRILFNNKNLMPTSQECRSIWAYMKTLNKETFVKEIEVAESEYVPPKTLDRVCAKINKYVKGADLDFRSLKIIEQRAARSLIEYLHNFRFIYQINSYNTDSDKTLFESAFVEYTWDKDDLSSEDLDQYIILCNEKIMAANILRNINQLEHEQQRIIDEEGKMSMTHVEALKSARTEYNDCVKRQQNLYKTLIQQRSERILEKKENLSLLNFFQLWTEEDTRNKILNVAIDKQNKLAEEIDNLANMDALIANINGISKEEVLGS